MSGLIGSDQFKGGGAPPFYPYKIDYSCRFNDDDSAALDVAAAPAMDDAKIFTFSTWVKRCSLSSTQIIMSGGTDGTNYTSMIFNASDNFSFFHVDAGATTDRMTSTAVYRDITNWYHFFVLYDSTDGTAGDRQRIWVNGVEITAWDIDDQAALNKTIDFGGNLLNIGCSVTNASYFDGYLAEMYFIDGTVQAVTDFGEFYKGVWRPKSPGTLTYGTAGFYLDFANSADFGSDQSGNANDFTDVNLAANDQVPDSPTNNYINWSTIANQQGATLNDGNLVVATAVGTDKHVFVSSGFPKSGKWYWEMKCETNCDATRRSFLMISDAGHNTTGTTGVLEYLYIQCQDGDLQTSATKDGGWSAFGAPQSGDIICFALDLNNGQCWITKNANINIGSSADVTDLDTSLGYRFSIYEPAGVNNVTWTSNFGQSGFNYTPPTGYLALNTTNIAAANTYTTAAMNPDKGFDVITYAGDDGATQAITGTEFQPDIVWIKNRSQADSHWFFDNVRGVTKYIVPDTNAIEVTDANDGLSLFNTDGFTVMFNALDNTNAAGENYVAWCWKEHADYGLDIVTFTGTGAAHAENHNLSGVPELMILKNLGDVNANARSWIVYHNAALNKTDPETDYGALDTSAAWADLNTIWNDVASTSTQFTVGTNATTNENNDTIMAYLFRSIEGFSKVFTFEGNGNADGPFVYCGFRPKFVMLKNADIVANWLIHDIKRTTENEMDDMLFPDSGTAETNGSNEIDFLSNGFKIRNADNPSNQNAKTVIGIAFAETPGIYANAR